MCIMLAVSLRARLYKMTIKKKPKTKKQKQKNLQKPHKKQKTTNPQKRLYTYFILACHFII